MKINSCFNSLVLLTSVLILVVPLLTFAQASMLNGRAVIRVAFAITDFSAEEEATRDAERDVEAHINKPMWFAIGCLFPGFGLLGPYLYRPPIPTGRTIGKSAEYVAFYTDAYRAKMEKLQFQAALNGCIAGAIAQCGLGMILIGTLND